MQLSIGSRGGEVHRIVARDRYVNGLNGEFLDVKARFGHGFINHPDRIKTPLIRYSKGGKLVPATWDAAIEFAAEKFKEHGPSAGVIASPRLTNESVFALQRFASEATGNDNFAVSDPNDLTPIFDNLTVPLCTHDIYVEPDARNSGAGRALIAAVRDEAKRRGANKVLLSVAVGNEHGQRLFERSGFRTTMLEMMLDLKTNNG